MGFSLSGIFKAITGAIEAVNKGGFFSTLLAPLNPYLAFAVNIVGSMAVSAVLSIAFAKKPKQNLQSQLASRNEMIKQAIVTRDTVYGLTKKSGAILFMESTNNNKDLHIVVQLASHKIQSIDTIYFNDEALTLSSTGTDTNGINQYKVTSPDKYSTESRFTQKTRALVVSEYVDVTYNVALPFGNYEKENGKGIEKGTTAVTLISDTAFSVSTNDTININGVDYGVSTGGIATGSGTRYTLQVTLSEGIRNSVGATSITYGVQSPSGQIQTRLEPYRDNANTPLPYLAGTTTTTNYAILAKQTFSDSSQFTVRIKQHLGSDDQLADADLVSEVSDWTTAHRLQGIAYLYVKLKYDADAFPKGIPNISAEIKGKKLFDFRTSTTAYSNNPALVLYDYLTDTRFGLSVSTDEIDTTSFTTVANICDEDITLSGGGTENRYEANGIVYSNIEPMKVIDDINSSMLGVLSYSNGKFILSGGKYSSPTISLDEDDLRGGLSIQTKQSRRSLFNTVKGVFTSPESNWQPADYPMVTSSTFVSEDNDITIFGNIDLPFTTSSSMAQRIAKVVLFKNRQQMVVNAPCKLSAFNLQVGDTVQINNTRLGWVNKVFQVADWTFNMSKDDIGIDLVLQETSSSVWDWNAEESEFISDNTNLPHFEDVSAPSVTAYDFMKSYSGVISTVLVIEVSSNQGTTNEFEVEYRNASTDIEFTSLGRSKGTKFEVLNAEDGSTYEIRARAINGFNVASSFTSITHEVVGKTEAPADVSNFSVNVVNNLAVCSWTPNTELDLSHYVIRHTSATSSPVYAGSPIVANYISKATNQISLPAQTGTYMIKAVDVLGLHSETSTKKVIIRNQIADDFNAVTTTTESPNFTGTKDGAEVVTRDSTNFLQIVLGELFDEATGNFDDAVGLFDDGADVESNTEGLYYFSSNPIDLGAIYNSYITTSMTSARYNANSLFDSFEGLFDSQEGNFDGGYAEFDDVDATIQISTSTDNVTYTDYQDYVLGNYKARYINLRAKLETTNNASTPAISALSATIDMPDRTIAEDNISSGTSPSGYTVTFSPAFKSLQAIAIGVHNLDHQDRYVILSEDETGFTIIFYQGSGTSNVVSKDFGYVAKGYGYLESS